jgi:hypothetical protein
VRELGEGLVYPRCGVLGSCAQIGPVAGDEVVLDVHLAVGLHPLLDPCGRRDRTERLDITDVVDEDRPRSTGWRWSTAPLATCGQDEERAPPTPARERGAV